MEQGSSSNAIAVDDEENFGDEQNHEGNSSTQSQPHENQHQEEQMDNENQHQEEQIDNTIGLDSILHAMIDMQHSIDAMNRKIDHLVVLLEGIIRLG